MQRRASLSGAQRFPAPLLAKLYEQVNSGKAPAGTYEWALGVQNTATTAEESARETPEMLSADEVLELLELLEQKRLVSSQERADILAQLRAQGRHIL